MFPNNFEYVRAKTVNEALKLLAKSGKKGKLLAGGHSLIPAMKLRLNSPGVLIDLTGIAALSKIAKVGKRIEIGALATHRAVETSALVQKNCGVLSEVASGIGDAQVRNHGTIGGSLAHADPAADYPAIALALGAEIEITGAKKRVVAAEKFFKGLFETALTPKDLITKVSFPVFGKGEGAAYVKFAHPASLFAIVGVAAMLEVDGNGQCTAARIGVTGASACAFRAKSAEKMLVGKVLDENTIAEATASTAADVDLLSDLAASAEYRAQLCNVMAKRAVTKAWERAREK